MVNSRVADIYNHYGTGITAGLITPSTFRDQEGFPKDLADLPRDRYAIFLDTKDRKDGGAFRHLQFLASLIARTAINLQTCMEIKPGSQGYTGVDSVLTIHPDHSVLASATFYKGEAGLNIPDCLKWNLSHQLVEALAYQLCPTIEIQLEDIKINII